jgi:hypothetical protein
MIEDQKRQHRRMNQTPSPSRSGFTLAEMVGVLMLMTTIIGMVATLTGRALTKYAHTMDRAMAIRMDSYWMERFRRDVHLATDSTIDPSGQSLVLISNPNESIEYTSTDTQLIRRRTIYGRMLSEEVLQHSMRYRFQRKPMPKGDLIVASSETSKESSDQFDSAEILARLGCQRKEIK